MEILKKTGQFVVSEKLGGVKHGFTLRTGGVSEGAFDSLNIGLRRGDSPFNAIKNIEICCDDLGLTKENLTLTYQTHTANVCFVKADDVGKGFIRPWDGGVDGIVTDLMNVPLLCYSADCVPILLYEPKARLVGAVHGGWRGTSGNIVKNAVKLMEEHGGKADEIMAFVGPAIGMCCYEVSEDVAECFSLYPECVKSTKGGKYHIDLKGITRAQMINEGMREENIEVCSCCTSCNNDMFFSHRKGQGKSGLLGGFIQMSE